MMPQRYPVGADAPGTGIQNAAAQTRAHRARGLARRRQLLDHAVGVFLENVVLEPLGLQVLRHDARGIARLLLIEMHRHQFEAHRRRVLQVAQDIQQRVGILAAGQAHHDPVAFADHGEVLDGPAHLTPQALMQLVDVVACLTAISLRLKVLYRHGVLGLLFRGRPVYQRWGGGVAESFAKRCSAPANPTFIPPQPPAVGYNRPIIPVLRGGWHQDVHRQSPAKMSRRRRQAEWQRRPPNQSPRTRQDDESHAPDPSARAPAWTEGSVAQGSSIVIILFDPIPMAAHDGR